ncbi:unnamed protein product [Sordaria macrospora k-hell]|uniref:Class E vacuolar protein-sorting machinery protein HSE1 n=1 Tax=Sordaria macrospora (strain ATCC MYA-333 / DSM 997 / K(L3346) / K-hell) TaxID=771870 RepID=F7VW93_SORMK|nr:uncharacterized protein SMAC_03471 [Sordaria macrospora k-hell]CCC09915.1 unnamed protein product [Sordaria macrospora k-hell]
MFRAAAAGPYDEAINKATDENLTSEDWGAIMEVCDRVATDDNGAKEAVNSMIKRLAHRNANVQLYTLEVANALSQNCGKNMHRELSSRAFTDALLKLANDRNTHTQVKAKILERMKECAPQKNVLTDADRQKEEEELQMALQLSLQEEERKKGGGGRPAGGATASSSGGAAAGSSNNAGGASGGRTNPTTGQADAAATPQPVPSGTTAATVSRVRALYDFVPSEPGELEFKKGDVIAVLESVYKDWWRGSLKGKTGIFPLNYVEKLTDPTPEELQREAQMEAEVFAEIKNVEKLLTLLSAGNTGPREEDNEEISKLYHQTLAIRPKLIKLIEKYSQKKDDFTQLNEKFIKARRDYEALLESSMSHPPGPSYHQYAMRPPMTNSYGAGGYGAPPPQQQQQQQEPPRFYTPAPAQDAPQYPTTSPSPNPNHFIRPAGTPAPYHMGGAEGPGQYQQQTPYPQQQQQPAYGGPSRPQDQRIPSGSNNTMLPAPLNTTSSPPPGNQYAPYQPPGASGSNNRTNSYSSANGGAPQELSTSAYDSPTAQHSTNPLSNPSYNAPSAPSYNQGPSGASNDDPYAPASPTATAPGAGPSSNVGSAPPPPSAPAPSAPSAPSVPAGYTQGGYHSQNPYQAAATAAAAAASSRPHAGYEGAGSEVSSTAPQPPAALQPGGGTQHQYKAYVPPGSAPSAPGGQEGPSAPGAPGQSQGQGQGQNDGLADYYRSAY